MLLKNLPDTNQKSESCEEYFNLVTSLIEHSQVYFIDLALEDLDSNKEKIFFNGNFNSNALF